MKDEARLHLGDASTQEALEAKGSAAAWDMDGLRGAYVHIPYSRAPDSSAFFHALADRPKISITDLKD